MTARLTQKPVKTMLNKEKIKELLNQRFEKDIHKKLSEIPTPDALKDVFKGAERIKRAIEQNEKIVIVGDYDVDGVIASVIMAEFFDDLGVSEYFVRIPNRFSDGYGLNPQTTRLKFASKRASISSSPTTTCPQTSCPRPMRS